MTYNQELLLQDIDDLKQERDELRAQVALLYDTLQHTHEDYLENGFISDRQAQHMSKALSTFPADAAQYVRGLEEALQSAKRAFDNLRLDERIEYPVEYQKIVQALAAKEDRG